MNKTAAHLNKIILTGSLYVYHNDSRVIRARVRKGELQVKHLSTGKFKRVKSLDRIEIK